MGFSQCLGSTQKDVECTFWILKGRLRILKTGIRLHGQESANRIFMTCCALHNWLLHVDGFIQRSSTTSDGLPPVGTKGVEVRYSCNHWCPSQMSCSILHNAKKTFLSCDWMLELANSQSEHQSFRENSGQNRLISFQNYRKSCFRAYTKTMRRCPFSF